MRHVDVPCTDRPSLPPALACGAARSGAAPTCGAGGDRAVALRPRCGAAAFSKRLGALVCLWLAVASQGVAAAAALEKSGATSTDSAAAVPPAPVALPSAPPPVLPPDAQRGDRSLSSRIAELEAIAAGADPDGSSSGSGTATEPGSERRGRESTREDALEAAIAAARELLALRELHLGPDSEAGAAWADSGAGEWWELTEARWMLRGLLALRDRSIDERRRLLDGRRLDGAGRGALQRGDLPAAEAHFAEALAIRLELLEPGHPDRGASLVALAAVRMRQADFAAADALLAEAIETFAMTYAGIDQRSAGARFNAAMVRQALGSYEAAEREARAAVAAMRRLGTGDDLSLVAMLNGLAGILIDRMLLGEAEALLDESIAMVRRIFVRPPPTFAFALNSRGLLLRARGKYAAALASCEEALAHFEQVHGGDHPDAVISLRNIASIAVDLGELAAAEAAARRAVAMARRVLAAQHPSLAGALAELGRVLHAKGETPAALECHEAAIAILRLNHPDGHPSLAAALGDSVAIALLSEHPATDATLDRLERIAREAAEMTRIGYGEEDRRTATAMVTLARILGARRDRFGEADALLREAIERLRRLDPEGSHALANALGAMAALRGGQGSLDDAEAMVRESIELRRRLAGGGDRGTVAGVTALADIARRRGRDDDALAGYLEALDLAEARRVEVIGGPIEHDRHAGRLDLRRLGAEAAILLLAQGRAAEALEALERARGRAALDLVAEGADGLRAPESRLRALGDEGRLRRSIAARESYLSALAGLRESEGRVQGLLLERGALVRDGLPLDALDTELAEWRAAAERRSAEADERWGELRIELHTPAMPEGPRRAEEIVTALRADEALLLWAFTESGAGVIAARPGLLTGAVIAASAEETEDLVRAIASARAAIAQRPADGEPFDRAVIAALAARLIPERLLRELGPPARLIVVPDGPLHSFPVSVAVEHRCGVPAISAPSASFAIARRTAGAAPRSGAVVLVGDCIFGRAPAVERPAAGVLVHGVTRGGAADQMGIRSGDVLTRYDGRDLVNRDGLIRAIAAAQEREAPEESPPRPIELVAWRDGAVIVGAVGPGRLGVHLDDRPLVEALESAAALERAVEAGGAGRTMLAQLRLHGGELAPLPWTRREVEAIAAIHGGFARTLVGAEATVPALRAAVLQGSPPRVLHLATHGVLGTARRPLEASLALTQPTTPTVDDIGFLTLAELVEEWPGALRGTELVVLSACDSAAAETGGESPIGLPLGFLAAGAANVIGSLWKVDDATTALLMARLHANLARGSAAEGLEAPGPLPVAAALQEAQAWLRTLTREERDALLGAASPALIADRVRGEVLPRRAPSGPGERPAADGGSVHPCAHPYYWAGFIVIGGGE
ncbi:MAG TPA: CHAT domain-containing protein [Phycisphaerales bacterium]|nr:CHAT domain-containing protein [Phycisphaerales bacterium]HMP37624.1 CHAT domain-containing protein [Phycisphaerales bacterium]